MQNRKKAPQKSPKAKLLAAIFSEGKKAGLEQEFIREEVAFAVIHKRLSKATSKELMRVLEHIKPQPPLPPLDRGENRFNSPLDRGDNRKHSPLSRGVRGVRYPSSKAGLIQELEDVARERWGEGFEKSLNRFVNSHRKVATHYRFLDVKTLKGFKKRLKEMNKKTVVS